MANIASYDVNATNNWAGGTVQIDNDNASIMATLVGAGIKSTTTNTFTGVLMGQFALNTSKNIANGLYGFKDGVMAFKLDTQANFFVGDKANSFMEFNGSNFNLTVKNNFYIGDQLGNSFIELKNNKLVI
jgi:hypothetical protein